MRAALHRQTTAGMKLIANVRSMGGIDLGLLWDGVSKSVMDWVGVGHASQKSNPFEFL